ncbi:hypothetical protein YC2023_011780 [Brassica napus]
MAADANPVLNYQKNREYHQGSCCRVEEDVKGDSELADVAVVSSGNNYDVGNMIAKALAKLRGTIKVAALKAPGFGERKSQYLDDIAALTGGLKSPTPQVQGSNSRLSNFFRITGNLGFKSGKSRFQVPEIFTFLYKMNIHRSLTASPQLLHNSYRTLNPHSIPFGNKTFFLNIIKGTLSQNLVFQNLEVFDLSSNNFKRPFQRWTTTQQSFVFSRTTSQKDKALVKKELGTSKIQNAYQKERSQTCLLP